MEKMDSLLSKEKGTTYKEHGGKVSVCLIYPNAYHLGMSNLGFQGIYTMLNNRKDVVCERAFFPDDEDMKEYVRTGMEIISLESKRPIGEFNIIAFSVSFENDYPNILRTLKMSRIPLRAADRRDIDPLVIMGGAAAFLNPEPVADFLDFCFVGEAEEMLSEFMDLFESSADRDELLGEAVKIEGIYAPRLYELQYRSDGVIAGRSAVNYNAPETIKRRFVNDISECTLKQSIITPDTEFSNMYLTEAMRGCPWNCRFCAAGHVYKPTRKKGIEALKAEICSAASLSSRIGLIAPSLTDYPHTREVICIDGIDFSITSLRASRKSAELVGFLKGHRSVSIAPEAGTERLRQVIDKKITEEDIVETARLILSGGVETLRLYFMVGLPTEEEGDCEGIVALVKKIRETSAKGHIVLSISTFVPKPFTPFQWHPMEKMDMVKSRLRLIKNRVADLKGVKIFHDVPKYAYMQGLFSMGDRRISRVLETMLLVEDWRRACTDVDIDPDFYIFRKKGFDEILPWDFIYNHISKEKLWLEYQKALQTMD